MMPQMEKVTPAGVNSVGYNAEISPVPLLFNCPEPAKKFTYKETKKSKPLNIDNAYFIWQ